MESKFTSVSMNKLLLAIAFVAVAGISFAGGLYAGRIKPQSAANTPFSAGMGQRGGRFGGGFGRGGRVLGTVKSITGTSMVITNQSCTDVTVSLGSSPTITDASGNTIAQSAIKSGDSVVVGGTPQSDGTVVAQRVRISTQVGPTPTPNAT